MADFPKIFQELPSKLQADFIRNYSERVGRPVHPSQVEYLIGQSFTNTNVLFRTVADQAVASMLIEYATGAMLDGLVRLADVYRLDAQPAQTRLRFSLVAGHGALTIPAGTRVGSEDGLVTFATDTDLNVSNGVLTAEVDATATADGRSGNGYAIGTIKNIIDTVPFLATATNLEVTAGGSEIETDEGLRKRFPLAWSQPASSNSFDGYQYYTRSVSSAIIDVAVTDSAGVVNVYPLMEGSVVTPPAILDAVQGKLDSPEVKPLGGIEVNVISPAMVQYEIVLNIVLKYGAAQNPTVQAVTDAIDRYCTESSRILGKDITSSQIIAAGMNENVHSLQLQDWTDLIISPTSFPVCTAIGVGSVTYENINV